MRSVSLSLMLAIAIAPLHAQAFAAPAAGGMPVETAPTQPETTPEGAPVDPSAPAPEPSEVEPSDEPTPPEPTPTPEPAKVEPKVVKPPPPKPVPEPDDDDDDDDDDEAIPQRLPPMQTAGWWTLFGGFAIGTVAGVLAGLAEREEDRAVRLSVKYDLDTGAQPQYADIEQEYENSLKKGRAEANAAIALAVVGLGAAVAGLSVLLVGQVRDRQRKRNAPVNARVRMRGGGLQVRF
ncbi:MAG TPA: hypothetical protein VG755_06795 [Nannocystaceae bacterium]|nr:hypothetical protein [Nannocystaceae bacterium]